MEDKSYISHIEINENSNLPIREEDVLKFAKGLSEIFGMPVGIDMPLKNEDGCYILVGE